MGDVRRKAAAFALELSGAYPQELRRETLSAWAKAFQDIGLDIADDVSALLRVRSSFPPSVAQIYEAAREVRKETMSMDVFDSSYCTYRDGVACSNPPCNSVIHGHLLNAGQAFHGAYHLGRHFEGISGELVLAQYPEQCDCGLEIRENVDVEKVVELVGEGFPFIGPRPRKKRPAIA